MLRAVKNKSPFDYWPRSVLVFLKKKRTLLEKEDLVTFPNFQFSSKFLIHKLPIERSIQNMKKRFGNISNSPLIIGQEVC